MEILDIHHHIWRREDLPWLAGPMQDAAGLAAACPDVTFVLQHAGMLEDRSEAGCAAWRVGMRMLAGRPNVVVKLSGLGTFLHRNAADHIAAVVTDTVEVFGAGRCLFGSNFPVEKLWTGYDELVDAYRAATAGLGGIEQEAVFRNTAARVYRLRTGVGKEGKTKWH